MKTREDNNSSTISEIAIAKGALPSVDHEKSKKKIDDLMFKPYYEQSEQIIAKSKKLALKSRDSNMHNPQCNNMPNMTTFDNRVTAEQDKLISNKGRAQGKPVPNQSMRNLNQDEEVLPVYKRRVYQKGPIKIGDKSYMKRPLKTHYASKRQNNWVHGQIYMSGEETNIPLNNYQPIKVKPNRSGRQQNDFRINRNYSKVRGKTAQGPRNQTRSTLATSNPNGSKKPSSTLNAKDNVPNLKTRKAKNPQKRSYSQHQEKIKKSSEKKRGSNHTSSRKFQKEQKLESDSSKKIDHHQREESKDFIEKGIENGDDVESMIKMAEAKIKATAEAMLDIHMADEELDKKIGALNDFESSHDKPQKEDDNIQDHIKQKPQPMTRQEKIANIVNDLVAKNTDLKIPEDYSEPDEPEEDEEEADEGIIENKNTLMTFTDKGLDSIKEQVTEEIHNTSVEDSLEYSKQQDKISNLFETQQKNTSGNKIEDTPAFGSKDPFSSFLCSNEISTQKKERPIANNKIAKPIFEEEVSKNILPEFDQDYDIEKIIKLQSLFRQILAERKLKEMKQRSYIIKQQRSLSSNKRKIIALRTITHVWLMYKEAKIAAQKCTYLDENAKESPEEPYHYYCDTMADLKFIEVQFRQRIFKKTREYLKTIPYECRQSYVKLIDCKIYQREINNRLKVMKKVADAKKKLINY
ncbi:unnamed protein product [Moneuplotes crassus]|uniref:Uncharacterized protein n=1 Tax=Euplotes crassus TaxID=5936 RepID=A0AAD2DAY3_EUPCR|nr:unnamed protein product [Moneuplotes crassus]